jgi:hypothetical protein
VRALAPRESFALRALPKVCAQRRAFGPREPAIRLSRDGALGVRARQRALELLPQRPPGAEEQRFDGADRRLEDLGDLRVRAPLELAHHEGRTLVEREVSERALDVLRARPAILLGHDLADAIVELDLVGATLRLAETLPADVVGDRDQPVLRVARPLAALIGAVRIQKRRLRDVLGVRGLPEDGERVPVHVADVLPVDPLEGPVRAQLLREEGRHTF